MIYNFWDWYYGCTCPLIRDYTSGKGMMDNMLQWLTTIPCCHLEKNFECNVQCFTEIHRSKFSILFDTCLEETALK